MIYKWLIFTLVTLIYGYHIINGHPICNGYNIFWPPSVMEFEYVYIYFFFYLLPKNTQHWLELFLSRFPFHLFKVSITPVRFWHMMWTAHITKQKFIGSDFCCLVISHVISLHVCTCTWTFLYTYTLCSCARGPLTKFNNSASQSIVFLT